MDLNASHLFVEFLFGLVGTAYFIYGKKSGNFIALGCGLALGLFPYFVANFTAIWIVGLLLVAVPFFIRN